jgi:1-acyl-sn-glycerol-3-phosphate acyltransferase
MTIGKRIVDVTIRGLTSLICRVDAAQLSEVPRHGPLLIVANHVNFLDVPVVYTRLQPRPITGFAKAETWDNPLLGLLFDIWSAIPLRRGELDLAALRQALDALAAGKIVGVAPEGTRSNDGCLQRGHPGIVLLALRSGAPMLPMAYYGAESYRRNLKRLRRSDFHIVVGHPFYLAGTEESISRQARQDMTDEIMYQLAALLPARYRGAYADMEKASERYLRFPPRSHSNLPHVGRSR